MKIFRPTPTLIALAVVAVLAGCGKKESTTPPATSSSSTTITTPAPTVTPPASSSSTTTMPPASSSSTTTITPSTSSTTPDSSSGTSGTGTGTSSSGSTTGSGSSSSTGTSGTGTSGTGTSGSTGTSGTGTSGSTGTNSPTPGTAPRGSLDTGGKLARASLSELRAAYGVELTQVADSSASSKLNRADRGFLKDAALGGMYEVQAAQIASERARDPAVKAFAEKLVKDHSAANGELKQLAGSRNFDLPTEPSMLKRRSIDGMRKGNDKNFDRDFVQKIGIKDHQSDIKLFEKAGRDAKDPDIRAWAEKTLPTLRQHLADARALPVAGRADASDSSRSSKAAATTNRATEASSARSSTMGTGAAPMSGGATGSTTGSSGTTGTGSR